MPGHAGQEAQSRLSASLVRWLASGLWSLGTLGLAATLPLLPLPWIVAVVASASAASVAWLAFRKLTLARHCQQSLKQLEQILAAVRAGEAPIDELSYADGPLSKLAHSIQDILRDLRRQKAELAALEQEIRQRVAQRTDALERQLGSLRQQANRDPLTGLYNRRMLTGGLQEAIRQTRDAGSDLCLLMLDLDNFKCLNDTLGHAAGDQLLRTIGQIIRSSIREHDLAFRCGGDEFVIALPNCGLAAGQRLAQHLVSLIDSLGQTLKTPRPLGLSVGLMSLAEASEEDLKALLVEVDKRLYFTKTVRKGVIDGRHGKNTPPAASHYSPAEAA